MTMAAGARMWECAIFTKDQMVGWENKPAAKQTWQALKDYFTERWLERCQYLQATAKQSCFKDAALAAQEQAAAETKGKATAMIFTLLQEQHKNQMEVMVTASQKAMDAMMEWMNALVVGHGKPLDKENTPPTMAMQAAAPAAGRGTRRSVPTVESTCSISRRIVTSLRPTQTSVGKGRNP